jgi:DsbC/DsbD-like thiol-disulfide interchange protein
MHLRAAILAANLVVMLAISRPALAADASPWDGDQRGAVRLIAAAQRGAIHHAGVEIRLAPGWKTYWRYPGDSGVPPRFDFSGSRNVKSVTVRYPAPQRLTDEGGTSIGYKRGVVFPLDVVPQDAAKPVALSAKIDYAVCERICIPAEGRAELAITGRPGGQDGWLEQNEALVPAPAAIGGNEKLAVRAVKREDKRILVDVATPGPVDLFAEGPTPDWALPVPTPIDGAPARAPPVAFEHDGLPPNAAASGAILKLTAVAGEQAIEVPYRLD